MLAYEMHRKRVMPDLGMPDVNDEGPMQPIVVTFGSPCVGNSHFKEAFDKVRSNLIFVRTFGNSPRCSSIIPFCFRVVSIFERQMRVIGCQHFHLDPSLIVRLTLTQENTSTVNAVSGRNWRESETRLLLMASGAKPQLGNVPTYPSNPTISKNTGAICATLISPNTVCSNKAHR